MKTLNLRNVAGWEIPKKLFIGLFTSLLLLAACSNTATAQGTLTNGWTYNGTIAPVGHSDTWTFSATNGQSIVIRMGEITSTNGFTPRIRLFNPNAVQQALASDPNSAEITVIVTNTGTFRVIADDAVGTTATGTYRLTLAQTGVPIVVAPGYQGGPLTNGFTIQGNMPVGQLGVWSFSANAGQAFVVRAGEITDSNFYPWVRVYGPDGLLLGSNDSPGYGEVAFQATNSGTFLVVVANYPQSSSQGNGTYLLTLAQTGVPIVVAPGYQGGSLTNGFTVQANMPVGLLGVWNFTASAGQAFVVRAGEMTDTNFYPWVRVYGPDGTLLGSNDSPGYGEVAFQATNSGTFLVVVANYPQSSSQGNGTYLLTLAQTGVPIVVAPGYQGGSLTGGDNYAANMPVGEIDSWTFTICAGEAINVQADAITSTNFYPWVRLYGPNGALLGSSDGATFGAVAVTATNSGTFLVVVANYPQSSSQGNGTYQLIVNGLSDGFKICIPVISGTNLNVGVVGGPPGTNGILFTTTNLTTPSALWIRIRTNQFDQFGVFEYTNVFNPADHQRFYRLSHP
jgi:hypothetical protein